MEMFWEALFSSDLEDAANSRNTNITMGRIIDGIAIRCSVIASSM